MKTGRPSDPMNVKELRGSRNVKPPVKPSEIEPLIPPVHLKDKALKHWERIEPILRKSGRLKKEDETALGLLCDALAETESCDKEEKRLWQKQVMEFLHVFGASPMSRVKGGFPDEKKPTGPESRAR
jgi:hypothetical protein